MCPKEWRSDEDDVDGNLLRYSEPFFAIQRMYPVMHYLLCYRDNIIVNADVLFGNFLGSIQVLLLS